MPNDEPMGNIQFQLPKDLCNALEGLRRLYGESYLTDLFLIAFGAMKERMILQGILSNELHK